MPTITINVGGTINDSLQIGDTAFYIPANQLVGGFNVNVANEDCIHIGVIKQILGGSLLCEIAASTPEPSAGDFVFFSKHRAVNEASIVGYYGKFRFVNNSKQKAELFSANCNASISS
jgi:hypothetical protein